MFRKTTLTMKKGTMFFDFDGLKFDTTPHHVDYMNKRFNIKSVAADYINNPPLDLVAKKYLSKDNEINPTELYLDLTKKFHESIEIHDETVFPIEGMVETIKLLAEKYTIVTVTARPSSGMHVIEHMLNKYVPNCISHIHCVWSIVNGEWIPNTKKNFIERYPDNKIAFFDDSATEIKKLQDIIPSYLFDPTGQNDNETSIQHRVRSWQEFGSIFL